MTILRLLIAIKICGTKILRFKKNLLPLNKYSSHNFLFAKKLSHNCIQIILARQMYFLTQFLKSNFLPMNIIFVTTICNFV